MKLKKNISTSAGFSLIEVILALGVFLVTALALVGLIGPILSSVNEVEQTDQIASVVSTVNSFLQDSDQIANAGQSTLEVIYSGIRSLDSLTIFVFQAYLNAESDERGLQIGFAPESPVNPSATLTSDDFGLATGTIYRVVLSASSILPAAVRSESRNKSTQVYTLNLDYSNYTEGYFAYEARIFPQQASPDFKPDLLEPYSSGLSANLESLAELEPILNIMGRLCVKLGSSNAVTEI